MKWYSSYVQLYIFVYVAGEGIWQAHDGPITEPEEGRDIWFIQGAVW